MSQQCGFAAGLLLLAAVGGAAENDLLWTVTYDSPASSDDVAYAVAIDPAANILVAGTVTRSDTGAGQMIRVAKHDAGGALLWAREVSGTEPDGNIAYGVAADGGGNAVAAGVLTVPYVVTLSTTTFTLPLPVAWIGKLSAAGGAVWTATDTGDFTSLVRWRGVSVDLRDGSIAVAGSEQRIVTPAGDIDGSNDVDAIVAKYDANGRLLWRRSYAGPHPGGYDEALAVAVDRAGAVVVTGWQANDDFLADTDLFVLKYDAAGTLIWKRTYTTDESPAESHQDAGAGVAVDPSGSIYVAGYVTHPGNLATNPLDWLVRKYGPDGTVEWSFVGDGAGANLDAVLACAATTAGRLIVAGESVGSDVLGRGLDSLVAEFTAAGVPVFSSLYDGGRKADAARGVAMDAAGNFVVVGSEDRGGDLGQGTNWVIRKFSGPPAVPRTPENVRVYPNPFRTGTAVGGEVKFGFLPAGTTVAVYTARGRLVRELGEQGGTARWDGRNERGERVATGVYPYVIRPPGAAAIRGLLAVEAP